MGRPTRRAPARQFSRSDRVAELVRELVANELERIGDDRLEMVTVTNVKIEGDLSRGRVYYSALTAESEGRLDEVAEAFDDYRWQIQQLVNRQIRARKVPQLDYLLDDVLVSALAIEDVLRTLDIPADDATDNDDASAEQAESDHSAADSVDR